MVIRPLRSPELVAQYYFAAEEREALRRLSGFEWALGFLRCWTRKEAYLKATGEGLGGDLRRVVVSLTAEEPARILRIAGDPHVTERWSLFHLGPTGACVGALAIAGTGWSVATRWWYWDPSS